MARTLPLWRWGAWAAANIHPASAQQSVDSKGQSGKVKLNQVVSGHLSELNGKYQLRLSDGTIVPGGYVGAHQHAGPAIRCITAGELTYVSSDGKTTIYKAGDCFYEAGDVSHTAHNATDKPTVLQIFEILPAAFTGESIMPVPSPK